MTNKPERYFVVSESELERLVTLRAMLSSSPGYAALTIRPQYQEAEAACRARPVEVYEDGMIKLWEEKK